ncbi:MAG: hypothetical protein ACM34J_15045 [Ignavibacteria bacterium]
MNKVQKFFKFVLPKTLFEKIENQSSKWFFECKDCGCSISFRDAGGLRAYATKKKKVFGYCRGCSKFKFLDVVKRD